MGRILFWILLGFVVYVGWRWWSAKQRIAGRRNDGTDPAAGADGIEAMVPCDVCGLNVPRSEALTGNGRWYCSDDHRQRGRS